MKRMNIKPLLLTVVCLGSVFPALGAQRFGRFVGGLFGRTASGAVRTTARLACSRPVLAGAALTGGYYLAQKDMAKNNPMIKEAGFIASTQEFAKERSADAKRLYPAARQAVINGVVFINGVPSAVATACYKKYAAAKDQGKKAVEGVRAFGNEQLKAFKSAKKEESVEKDQSPKQESAQNQEQKQESGIIAWFKSWF